MTHGARPPRVLRSLLRRGGTLLHRLAAGPPEPSGAGRAYPSTWSWAQTAGAGAGWYREVDPAHSIYRRPPRGGDGPLHWKFLGELQRVSPATFVAMVPGGQVVGPSGAVFTPTGHRLGDVSVELGRGPEHPAPGLEPGRPARRDGTLVVLSAAGGASYFHWLFDVLPRWDVLRRGGAEFDGEETVLVNALVAPYQRDTLERLGLAPSRIVTSETHPRLSAERLLVPSLPGMSGNPTRRACDFLRARFLTAPAARGTRRIYVSRAGAESRRVLNEEEIVPVLERFGVETVRPERLPFAAQVELFASAEWVVGPHGAGLSNLVFSRPGTRVLEFFSPSYVNVCYWALGEQTGAAYAYLIGEGQSPPEFVDPHHAHADLVVDPAKLERALARWGRRTP